MAILSPIKSSHDSGPVVVGFDFDGTLVCPRQGTGRNFHDPRQSILDAAALLGPFAWLRSLRRRGYQVIVITGRPEPHRKWIRAWLRCMLGQSLDVYCRPAEVLLDCPSQARWKARVLREEGVSIYVGDNWRIDGEAAMQAHVDFVDVADLIAGRTPRPPNRRAMSSWGRIAA